MDHRPIIQPNQNTSPETYLVSLFIFFIPGATTFPCGICRLETLCTTSLEYTMLFDSTWHGVAHLLDICIYHPQGCSRVVFPLPTNSRARLPVWQRVQMVWSCGVQGLTCKEQCTLITQFCCSHMQRANNFRR